MWKMKNERENRNIQKESGSEKKIVKANEIENEKLRKR
jgi:hypothetical protein